MPQGSSAVRPTNGLYLYLYMTDYPIVFMFVSPPYLVKFLMTRTIFRTKNAEKGDNHFHPSTFFL